MWSTTTVLVGLLTFSSIVQSINITDVLNLPKAENLQRHVREVAGKPHLAGTIRDYETAVYLRDQWASFGIASEIQEYQNLLPYPISRSVTLVSPSQYSCTLEEGTLANDPYSTLPDVVPTFNGYSANGTVQGSLLYVNYGSTEDYELLKKYSITVTGKIVIVRYGKINRGIKVMLDKKNGAVGILIYSDPRDDGYFVGDEYPNGPMRSNTSVQRGSTLFLNYCPGNPDAERMKQCFESTDTMQSVLPTIPVQPLSYSDAEPLLRALRGNSVPTSWQGGLPFHYHMGPGPAVVNLTISVNLTTVPSWNVIGKIAGTNPDQIVFLGSHRDAWVFGASDPTSGTAVLTETARILGQLIQDGWKPKRSIMFGSWGSEEQGLIGSTTYGETNSEMLKTKTVAYLNGDAVVFGVASVFSAQASPTLHSLVKRVSKLVNDPKTGKPLSETWSGDIGVLGSGSDFAVFVDHLGIPSVNYVFAGAAGIYHSKFDDVTFVERFGDPNYLYHVAATQFMSAMAFFLLDDDVIPIDPTTLSTQLAAYYIIVTNIGNTKSYAEELDWGLLESAIDEYTTVAKALSQEVAAGKISSDVLNPIYIGLERTFLSNGLPKRPWHKHVLQAPDFFDGYGDAVLPGIQDTLRMDDVVKINNQIHTAGVCVQAAAKYLSAAVPWASSLDSSTNANNGFLIVGLLVLAIAITVIVVPIVHYFWKKRKAARERQDYAVQTTDEEELPTRV